MKEKSDHRFESILLYLMNKRKSHLRTPYDLPHLADLAPVDNRIHSTNLYPVYIQRIWLPHTCLLNSNLSVGLPFPAFAQPVPVLQFYLLPTYSAKHRLSARLLQGVITVIFSHQNKTFIGRARRVQIKSVVLLLLPVYSNNKNMKQTFKFDLNPDGSPVQVFPSPVNPALHAHA